jgi:hypothetical protein
MSQQIFSILDFFTEEELALVRAKDGSPEKRYPGPVLSEG